MGKREVGQLQPYEFVITIVIAELAGASMADANIPILYGIIAMLACFMCHFIISSLSLKSAAVRKLMSGKPTVIIDKGVIDYKEMKRNGYNMSDLLTQLRSKDQFDVSQIYYAILETNGELTVFPRSAVKVPDVTDLKLSVKQKDIPHTLILDGKPYDKTMHDLGVDPGWLTRQINSAGFSGIRDILFAGYANGELFLHTRDRQHRKVKIHLPEGA
jgi:uncharacterized membrane protein YcaP (DUF421 family)